MSRPLATRHEWLWVIAVLAGAALVGLLPYWVGYRSQTPEWVFSGALWDRMDYSVHIGTMWLGQQGDWAYRFRFTAEPQPGSYVKSFYILLGHAARWSGLSLEVVYHVGRVVFGMLSGLAAYAWLALTFPDLRRRRVAFLLALFGSGLGWLQMVLGWQVTPDEWPIDFWLMDGYLYFGMLVFPHYAAATALMVGMVSGYLAYLRSGRGWTLAGAALAGLPLQVIQPFAPLLPFTAMAGALAALGWTKGWRSARFRRAFAVLALVGLVQVPLLAYNLFVFSQPVWRQFSAQNLTHSPSWASYLLGFAIFWPLAVLGAGWLAGQLAGQRRLPVSADGERPGVALDALAAALTWVSAALFLAFVPNNLQRRFMHAISLPLTILAVQGLYGVLFPWVERRGWLGLARRQNLIVVLLIVLAGLSSLELVVGMTWHAATRPEGLFERAGLEEAVLWLDQTAETGDVALAARQTSLFVAERSGLTLFAGHGVETLNALAKAQDVEDFYAGQAVPGWLERCGCQWVIYGPHERQIGPGPGAAFAGQLEPVYQNPEVIIYRVRP